MRIDTQLYLVWCDSLDIDESEAHQVEATSPAEAVDLVCQSVFNCSGWPCPPEMVYEVSVCNAHGTRDDGRFFVALRPTFDITAIEQEPS